MNLPPVILASASPRRVELLRQLVFRFKVVPSAADECEHEQFTAWEIAQLNAYRKARLFGCAHRLRRSVETFAITREARDHVKVEVEEVLIG